MMPIRKIIARISMALLVLLVLGSSCYALYTDPLLGESAAVFGAVVFFIAATMWAFIECW